jgi:hypothetical protein
VKSLSTGLAEGGQTLVEFILVLPILAAAIAGTFWLLRASALRTECSRVVFEAVRAELNRSEPPLGASFRNGVFLTASQDGVEGWKKCGTHLERLFLPILGHRKPGV